MTTLLKQSLVIKVQNYFNLNDFLEESKLSIFLQSVDLSETFQSESDRHKLWKIMTNQSEDTKKIELNQCLKSLNLFQTYLKRLESEKPNSQIRKKSKQTDEDTLAISQISRINSNPHEERQISRALDNTIAYLSISSSHEDKEAKQQRITCFFKDLNLDQAIEIKKIFSLLDLRSRESLYLNEIFDLMDRHCFVRMTFEEIMALVLSISGNSNDFLDDRQILSIENFKSSKILICLDFYESALLGIDQNLKRDEDLEYDRDPLVGLLEECNRVAYLLAEKEAYVNIIGDLSRNVDYLVESVLIKNYEKLIEAVTLSRAKHIERQASNSKSQPNEKNKSKTKESQKSGPKTQNTKPQEPEILIDESLYRTAILGTNSNLREKLKDIEFFTKELKKLFTKSSEYMNNLNQMASLSEQNYKDLEAELQKVSSSLQDSKYSSELLSDMEKMLSENRLLVNMIEEISNENRDLKADVMLKEEDNHRKSNELASLQLTLADLSKDKEEISRKFDLLKNDYDVLISEVYQQIVQEQKSSAKIGNQTNKIECINSQPVCSLETRTGNTKNEIPQDPSVGKDLNERTLKQVLDMDRDQLVNYSMHVDTTIKKLKDRNRDLEAIVTKLKDQVKFYEKSFKDNDLQMSLIKSQNNRLEVKIGDLSREVELSRKFKQGIVTQIEDNQEIPSSQGIVLSKIDSKQDKGSIALDSKEAYSFKESNPKVNDHNLLPMRLNQSDSKKEILNDKQKKPKRFKFVVKAEQSSQNSSQVRQSQGVISNQIEINFARNPTFAPETQSLEDISIKNQEILALRIPNNTSTIDETGKSLDLKESNRTPDCNSKAPFDLNPLSGKENTMTMEDIDSELNSTMSKRRFDLAESIYEAQAKLLEKHLRNFSAKGENKAVSVLTVQNPRQIDLKEVLKRTKSNKHVSHNPGSNIHISDKSLSKKSLQSRASNKNLQNRESFKSLVYPPQEHIGESNRESQSQSNPIDSNKAKNNDRNSLMQSSLLYENNSLNSYNLNSLYEKNINFLSNDILGGEANQYQRKFHPTYEDLVSAPRENLLAKSHDYLSMRKNPSIHRILDEFNEEVSSYEMFSDNIYHLASQSSKSKEVLFVTSNAIYIIAQEDTSVKLRYRLKDLEKISISSLNSNLVAFNFNESYDDDLLIEVLRRTELLYFMRNLFRVKALGNIRFKYCDSFRIRWDSRYTSVLVDRNASRYVQGNFESAQKMGYLEMYFPGFFTGGFKERFVVLSDIGLLGFEEVSKPQFLVSIIGSEVYRVEEKKYSKRNCFEIKTLNGEIYVFSAKYEEDVEGWIKEFAIFKKVYTERSKFQD